MPCSASGADPPLISSLADYLECHASALGQNGFEGAANGFLMTAMLTGCLTIYVALIGYRLVLGQPYTVRDAILACVRVGLIITFCTRWPSYEAVFYRTVVEGPQEIAGQMLQSSGLPILSEAEMADRLGQDYQTIQAAANKLPLPPGLQPAPQPPGVAPSQTATPTPPSTPTPSNAAVSVAGLVFLISTIGSLLSVHFAAGLLMAIGPLVLVLALFDSLVGLFENWVAALAGLMLATAGITILTELELDFVESRLSEFSGSGAPLLTDQGLLLTAVVFSLCVVGVVVAAGLVGRRLKFRSIWVHARNREARPAEVVGRSIRTPKVRASGPSIASPSRALAVANAVSLEGERERVRFGAPGFALPNSSGPQTTGRSDLVEGGGTGSVPNGLGYSLRRPAGPNRTISYTRRGRRQ